MSKYPNSSNTTNRYRQTSDMNKNNYSQKLSQPALNQREGSDSPLLCLKSNKQYLITKAHDENRQKSVNDYFNNKLDEHVNEKFRMYDYSGGYT